MSEVQSRPAAPRGRGSARGGRGGFSSRGGRGGRAHTTNGDKPDTSAPAEDEGEVAQLKQQYGTKVTTIKEMFPDWTDGDIVFALQETDGDLETTVERITDGSITQWGEVSKTKKDRSKSKVKDAANTAQTDGSNQAKPSRGGRGGFDAGRGRGRGTERGRGGRGRGGQSNGTRKENAESSAPTTESSAWDTNAPTGDAPALEKSGDDSWGATAASAAATTVEAAANTASSIIPDGVKKSWASMFAPAPTPKKAPEPIEKLKEPAAVEEPIEPEPAAVEVPTTEAAPAVSTPEPTIDQTADVIITPSKDELTEDNLEQVPDASNPAPTATAASTAASSWDPRNTPGTPYSALQQNQAQAVRPPTSGYQASALKATGGSGRTPSFQRRVLDQEEAVRMPGNREVDRTAVQFGAFNLNGSGDEDVDGEREEPETRAQPPQHSPVTHPRASLPPAPQQSAPGSDAYPTPKQSVGLPAATHPTAAPGLPSPQPFPGAQSAQQGPANASQYGRYGPAGVQESSLPPKPFDAFSQQAPSTQSPFEGYPGQQAQSQPQTQSGAFSSAPNEYSQYYTADPQQRNYNNYYQQHYGGQPGGQVQQDGSAPQRSFSGYGGPQADNVASQLPQGAGQQSQSRFGATGEGQNSGHSTPNPVAQGQQQGAGQQQAGHPPQPQGGNYPYGHPYYSSPYYAQYMNQQYQQYGAGNYGGGPYGAKGGVHGQGYPGYGMSPGAPYEHASSPAGGAFGGSSLHGRDSALGGSLGDYGRAGSAQSSQAPQSLGSGAFAGSHDAFGRGSSYQGQSQQQYNAGQGNQAGSTDDLKPFGESKTSNGPSPSIAQAGRPGSATNTTTGSALPPPQSQQGGYGGYPSHLQQGHQAGSQYGLGGAGGHQAAGQGHQNSQYGGYQGFGGNYYGNNQQRGGWGATYGQH